MTPWAHLPNAVHIDRVLASVKANPEQWEAAWDAAREAAWVQAQQVVRAQMREPAWDAAWEAAWEAGWYAATRYAIIALVAYDDCAYMLDSDPGELAILAKFGDHRAVLLLTACKVFHLLKTIA